MEGEIIVPYSGFTIEVPNKTLYVNATMFCERWDQIDPDNIVQEEEAIALAVFWLLDYDGPIDKVIFVDAVLHCIFEFDLLTAVLRSVACRPVRPTTIQVAICATEDIADGYFKRLLDIVEANRYCEDWIFSCNTSNFAKFSWVIFRPFFKARHVKRFTLITPIGKEEDVDLLAADQFVQDLNEFIINKGISFCHLMKESAEKWRLSG